jgi:Carboxypeptidase regulatory-like domain
MHLRPCRVSATLWVLIAASFAGAQAQRPAPQPGVASLRGRLIAADTGLPFRDATVSLQPFSSQPPAPGREGVEWMTLGGTPVDAEGRFELPDVPAGSFRLVATPLQTAMRYVQGFYPEISSDGPRSFTVSSREAPPEIVIALPRGAAIAGRVVDEHGTPKSHVSVTVRESLAADRTRAPVGFTPSLTARTDDNGSFRIFGLQAGDYIVVAQAPAIPTGLQGGMPRSIVYPPTYYPAAFSATEAARIRLRPGDEHGPVDIVLQQSRLLTIRGVLVDSSGTPVAGLPVKLQKATSPIVNQGVNTSPPTTAEGAFEIRMVPPGDYALTAYRYGADATREFAWTPVSATTDGESVMVRLQPAADVDGLVIFETPPTESLVSLRIRPVEGPGAAASPAVQVKDDGSFALEHLFGPVVLRPEGWKGWHVKSVVYGGRDITDEPTELVSGTALRVTLTQRLGTLSGVVTNERGDPVGAAVLVFAEEPASRHERSTMTKMVFTAASGKYIVEGLRPGRYIAAAVPRDAASLSEATAAYFEMLSTQGSAVEIRDRDAGTLNLKLLAVR